MLPVSTVIRRIQNDVDFQAGSENGHVHRVHAYTPPTF